MLGVAVLKKNVSSLINKKVNAVKIKNKCCYTANTVLQPHFERCMLFWLLHVKDNRESQR